MKNLSLDQTLAPAPPPSECPACNARMTGFSGDTAHYECHAAYSVSFNKFIYACFTAHGNYPVLLREMETLTARLEAVTGERDALQARDFGDAALASARKQRDEARAELTTLRALVAEMRDAAMPLIEFVDAYDEFKIYPDTEKLVYAIRGFKDRPDVFVSLGMLRALRAALAPGGGVAE